MANETMRLQLPLLQPAQAQKHVTVNEALMRLDGLTNAVLESASVAVPPEAAQLIASLPRDAWYLTLLPSSYVPAPLPDFDPLIELLPGENPNQLTPYGPEGIQEEDAP